MANWIQEATQESYEIESWRRDQLVRAGYSSEDAERIASRYDVDLHVAVALVERGCDSELALRILL